MYKKILVKPSIFSLIAICFVLSLHNSAKANWFNFDLKNTKYNNSYKPKNLIRTFPKDLEINTREVPWISKSSEKSTFLEPNFITQLNYGTAKLPFTTSLAKSAGSFKSTNRRAKELPTSAYPFLSSGGVWSLHRQGTSGGKGYIGCTGSLIGPGLVITTASCFYDYGEKSDTPVSTDIHTSSSFKGTFVPGATDMERADRDSGPLGFWHNVATYINRKYLNGTCKGGENFTSCNLAILILRENQSGETGSNGFPGDFTKPFRYSNGYGFVRGESLSSLNAGNKKIGQITTIGYSTNIGEKGNTLGIDMVRNDALGMYYLPRRAQPHFMYGSNSTSSLTSYEGQGSPIIVNFGTKYKHANNLVNKPIPNVLVGIQTICSAADVCIGLRFAPSKDFPDTNYRDDDGKNWGPGHIGYAMRSICGTGDRYSGGTFNTPYCVRR